MGAMSLPQILFSVIGGALIDRMDPKRFMMTSDTRGWVMLMSNLPRAIPRPVQTLVCYW